MKFPDIFVKLSGNNGNAYSIMGAVAIAMKKAGVSAQDIDAYQTEATSGDYDHLLHVTMNTVNVT